MPLFARIRESGEQSDRTWSDHAETIPNCDVRRPCRMSRQTPFQAVRLLRDTGLRGARWLADRVDGAQHVVRAARGVDAEAGRIVSVSANSYAARASGPAA